MAPFFQRSLDLRVDSFSCFSRAKSSPIIRIPQLLQVNKGSSENQPAKMKARWQKKGLKTTRNSGVGFPILLLTCFESISAFWLFNCPWRQMGSQGRVLNRTLCLQTSAATCTNHRCCSHALVLSRVQSTDPLLDLRPRKQDLGLWGAPTILYSPDANQDSPHATLYNTSWNLITLQCVTFFPTPTCGKRETILQSWPHLAPDPPTLKWMFKRARSKKVKRRWGRIP